MATYYKRVEREADSQVNWAEIGKSMSDMLANENKVREDKKAAIDKASRDYAEVLANSPQGEHVGARQQALDFANNASQYMLMQDKLLKSGQLKLKDYTVTRQNLVDDTDRAFKMNAEYQKVFAEKMERSRTDISALYELDAMERIEGFGNFSQSGMYIDPTTGKVSVAMREKQIIDGKEVYTMPENPEKRTTIDTLNGLLLGKWDKYKVNEATTAFAGSIGENIQTLRTVGSRTKAGQILTVSDVLSQARQEADINAEITSKESQIKALEAKGDKKSIAAAAKLKTEVKAAQDELVSSKAVFDFVKFETEGINSMLANDFNRMSVLTDNKKTAPNGKIYRFTRDKNDAKLHEEAILMVPDPASGMEKPQFSEAQLKESTEFMRTNLRGKYDYKETSQAVSDYQSPSYAPQYVYAAGQQKKIEEDMVTQWMNIYTAKTAADKDAAAENLLGTLQNMNAGVIDVDPTATGVTIKYADGRSIPIEYAQGGAGNAAYKSGDQWAAAGRILHGVGDQNMYNKFKGSTFSNISANEWDNVGAAYSMPTGATTTTEVDKKQILDGKLAGISPDTFKSSDNDVANYLNQELGPLGFTFTSNDGGYGNQYVTVTPPSGDSFTLDANEKGDPTDVRNKLVKQIEDMLKDKDPNKILKGGGVGANYNPKPK
jgi:hypothetical protein